MKSLRNFERKNGASEGGNAEKILQSYGIEDENLKKYSAMDEDALIAELMKNVAASKRNGTYDPERMSAFIAMMSPSLSDSQREKLNNIVKIINGEA